VGNVSAADWVVIAEFILFLVALVAFVLFYVVSSHGRAFRSPEGRHLLNFRAALIAWAAMGITHNLVPAYVGRDVVRIAILGWVAFAAVEGTYLMVRAQLARRRAARAES
jgi:hypothetical protein